MIDLYAPIGTLDSSRPVRQPQEVSLSRSQHTCQGDRRQRIFLKVGRLLKPPCAKKGDSVFEIGRRGFSEAKIEALEKTLARDAVSKL